MSKQIALEKIRTDGGTQMRAKIDNDLILEYRDNWIAKADFPPIDVFYDGTEYWLADGFHRFYGAREAGLKSIPHTLHTGSLREAILFAVGANTMNGLRRSNADKRQAVLTLLNDEEWVKWSGEKIADTAGVSTFLVSEIKRQLLDSKSSLVSRTKDEPKLGKDGKKRKAPTPKPQTQERKEDKPEEHTQPKQYNDPFDPEQLETQKPPKNGKAVFDDAAVDPLFGKIVRLYDQREAAVGGSAAAYKECRDTLNTALVAWRALCRA